MENSQVLVTFRDPSGVYPSIHDELEAHLPLRNLNWNSPSRPLRSIPSLQVDLVSEHDFAAASDAKLSSTAEDSHEIGQSRGRRHQIPGLRRSPYLKIYFLKCDDVDNYRNVARKDLREWVKANSPPSQSNTAVNKQDNHDAFEWLIVHVVDSGNGSAAGGGTKGEGESAKRTGRWPSRSSTSSVIDKLQSDFNSTSKNATERVVQISTGVPLEQSEQVARSDTGKDGWDDLLMKMKSLILTSFDLRVLQYEDDIKEKEAQRKVPGWNFNTFFVLKEGLARGFESMGLLEDALTGYQELSTELNGIINDHDKGAEAASPFNEFTSEMQEELDGLTNPSQGSKANFGCHILDTNRKDFRQLILSNNISIFDFEGYVFARRMHILLRIANASHRPADAVNGNDSNDRSARHSLEKPGDHEPENLLVLTEACRLASAFISEAPTQMRKEFEAYSKAQDLGKNSSQAVDNLVNSWTISACQTVLAVTASHSLSSQLAPIVGQFQQRQKSDQNSAHAISREQQGLPKRTSSLSHMSPPMLKSNLENGSHALALDALRLLPPGTPHPGAQNLAAARANIILASRRALNETALRLRGWSAGLASAVATLRREDESMEDVDLDDASLKKPDMKTETSQQPISLLAGCRNVKLALAIKSNEDFQESFFNVTIDALAHFVVANRMNVAEAMVADVAVNRFSAKDYASAASYFDQLGAFYSRSDWIPLEKPMLFMQAKSLQNLGRVEEYIEKAFRVIAIEQKGFNKFDGSSWHISALLAASALLRTSVYIPLRDHFNEVRLDQHIRHCEDHDGFQMQLTFRSVSRTEFPIHSIGVEICNTGKAQANDIVLENNDIINIKPGIQRVLVSSNTMRPGWYRLKKISIRARNVVFTDAQGDGAPPTLISDNKEIPSSHRLEQNQGNFLVWAHNRNLYAEMKHFESIDLRKAKSLRINIFSGDNEIQEGQVSMRAASAGLRLDTAEANVVDGGPLSIKVQKAQPGTITFGKILSSHNQALQVPYTLEHDPTEVTVRLEITYHTNNGIFMYASECTCNISLPLSVNVQDIFKENALFSRFTVGPVTSTPIRLHSCRVDGNSRYDAISSRTEDVKTDVYFRQPYSLISRIQRKERTDDRPGPLSRPFQRLLHLRIEYHCLDQEILAILDASLLAFLESNSLAKFYRALQEHLNAALKNGKVLSQDVESCCLLGKISKGSFENYEWTMLLDALSVEDKEHLEQALNVWHKEEPTLRFSGQSSALVRRQHLTVPFDLPETDALFVAELTSTTGGKASRAYIALDQPLPLQLTITRARKWDSDSEPKPKEKEPVEFCYELHASPDVWLIGGQRRARFSIDAGESTTFEVLLLPRMTGRLLYPSLEIAPVSSATSSTDRDEGLQQQRGEEGGSSSISYETDFLNQGETVLVVPNHSSTTVSLDPANGGWLVESKSREP